MIRAFSTALLLLAFLRPLVAEDAKLLAAGLRHPHCVVTGPDGRLYVALGGGDEDADSVIVAIRAGHASPFGPNFEHVGSMAWFQQWLFVSDRKKIWKLDLKGKRELFATSTPFPLKKRVVDQITVDPETGNLYVSDYDHLSKCSQIFRITPKGDVTAITQDGVLLSATRLLLDGASSLIVPDGEKVLRVNVASGKIESILNVPYGTRGLAWDMHGRLFLANTDGKMHVVPRPGTRPVQLQGAYKDITGICLAPKRDSIIVADGQAGTITSLPAQVPNQPVDFSLLPFETAVAFPDLKWTGWQGETDDGKINPLRPIVLTHAGDGSKRVFVATQQGVIHVFPNDPKVKETRVFLDIEKKVRYKDDENEEGFLGLCFHPDYKKNGEFFVFYTPKNQKLVNVVSRFRVSKDDPNKADPASEEEIFRVKRPFWNHDGGTIIFGPDGYLYIALGDGGAANDPFGNGQNLKQPLGKILRIDVNKKDPGKKYAVPADNPFVTPPTPPSKGGDRLAPPFKAGERGAVLPETWAYGLRNVWRMAFDRKTGKLWASDVGQNLYEEIDIIEKGGNYGWNLREGLHPFGPKGVGPRKDLIEPIWEYHHDVGKSLTGGCVYRGKKLPELDGYYLCADYVTGKIWALRYDENEKRVTEWRSIRDKALPIMSFGEDDQGEVYLLTYAASGRGIYQLVRTTK